MRWRAALPLAGALLAVAQPTLATARRPVPSGQLLVRVLAAKAVHSAPQNTSAVTTILQPRRPLTGTRTVLPVFARTRDSRGRRWLHVRLPGRTFTDPAPPATGWIQPSDTFMSSTPWQLSVDLSARRLRVYRGGRQQRTFRAIVGKPSTPTPSGAFFIEENVRLPSGRVGAPFALALNARSSTLQEFDGGPGQIAIHGLGNVGGQIGTAESHGCIRLTTPEITWLANRIAPGTPVEVTP
ncbi:MAG: ErfK/YbiS/YcfS/YnhG family protein [Solirubrobacterales bacterium]|nr:ErfK/YbiS/YcfS/YnhG family protein [Solirubrobacterales bacterium]